METPMNKTQKLVIFRRVSLTKFYWAAYDRDLMPLQIIANYFVRYWQKADVSHTMGGNKT